MLSLLVVVVGRNKSSQFRHKANFTRLPELRKALFRPTGKLPACQFIIMERKQKMHMLTAGKLEAYPTANNSDTDRPLPSCVA